MLMEINKIIIITIGIFLIAVFLYDIFQKKHAILRNFPIIGHLKYLLDMISPELR